MANILVLIGSPRANSNSQKVGMAVEKQLSELGIVSNVINLHDFKLPMFEGYEAVYGDNVERWKQTVASAHGIVIVSPEYHGFIPGALKNALDFLDDLENKVVGLVSVSSGKSGGHFAINALMQICRNMAAWLVPLHVVVNDADNAVVDNKLKDPALAERVKKVSVHVHKLASLLKGG